MNQDTILLIGRLVDEIEDLNSDLVVIIKQELPVIIKPVEGQVFDTDLGPLVLKLAASAINRVAYLVHSKKLEILSRGQTV